MLRLSTNYMSQIPMSGPGKDATRSVLERALIAGGPINATNRESNMINAGYPCLLLILPRARLVEKVTNALHIDCDSLWPNARYTTVLDG